MSLHGLKPPQVFLCAHLQPVVIYLMRPWSPSGTSPDATSQQAEAYAELVVEVHDHLGHEAEGAICELETKKLCFLSVTQVGSTSKELKCQTKCIS